MTGGQVEEGSTIAMDGKHDEKEENEPRRRESRRSKGGEKQEKMSTQKRKG